MAYPGRLACAELADERNGPFGLAPRELLTIPWFIHFLRTGRPKAWRASIQRFMIERRYVWLYRDMLGETHWDRLFRPTGGATCPRDLPSFTGCDFAEAPWQTNLPRNPLRE